MKIVYNIAETVDCVGLKYLRTHSQQCKDDSTALLVVTQKAQRGCTADYKHFIK